MTIQEATVLQLINARQYCLDFIAQANRRISAQGGWIAREANWHEIEICQQELDQTNAELNKR